ncbi:MAG: methionine--tRNA ligase subunit beta, partial [candidate division WOR-3 bacterium]
ELADILGNFVNRVLLFIKRNLKGKVPEDWELANEVLETIKEVKIRAENFIENFEIKNGLKELMKLPSFGNQYFDYQAPWQSVKSDLKKCEKTIANCLILIKSIEVLFRPYLPFTCEKIRNFLDLEKFEWDDVLEKEFLLRKPILKEVEILFNKIPNEKIELQLKKLKGGKMEITIEDFKKLDLRVGRVLNCERVKGTDKLLVFEIDIGNELRQIVAGIGNTYEPKDLIGKNVIVVCNLQPIKIKGIESNGMILAVGEEKAIAILTTDKDVPPGSIVR